MRITCQVPRLGRQRGKLERHNVKFDLLALMRWSYHSGVYILWPVSHFSVQTGFSVYPDHFHVILKICLGNLYCNSISFLFVSQTGLWIVSLIWFPARCVSSAAPSTPMVCVDGPSQSLVTQVCLGLSAFDFTKAHCQMQPLLE